MSWCRAPQGASHKVGMVIDYLCSKGYSAKGMEGLTGRMVIDYLCLQKGYSPKIGQLVA
jgi:hypothetical protein